MKSRFQFPLGPCGTVSFLGLSLLTGAAYTQELLKITYRKVARLVKTVKTTDKFHCLMKSKLFADLDDTALKEISDAGRLRHIAPKTHVIVAGERPDHLFLLQRGRARSYILTESGSEIVLLWVVPGGALGLASLLANPPTYMVNATTVTECEFLAWDRDTIRRLGKAYPQLTENGLRLALHYLRRYMKRHVNIVTKSAESRLAQRLLYLASEAGVVQPPGIAIDITNEQLSSLSDISPFTASRLLSRWEHEHWLTKQRGQVLLLAPEDLEALVAA
jgi:CRP-like cAMP-binding protein